jgi:putative transposase
MPLKTRTIMELRDEVVRRVKHGLSIAEAARQYGISRPTIYDWVSRYEGQGIEGLANRSRAPHCSPNRTAEAIRERLIAERTKWRFGSKAILQRLREEDPKTAWPARSTVDGIFKSAGLTQDRRRRERKRVTPFLRPYEATKPGELLTVDFKGQFRLRDGQLCYPLTLVDSVSKYVLACEALGSTHLEPAWKVIDNALREHGLPVAVQSDNGPPFGANGYGRLSKISVRLMKLGVLPVFSRPGKPQDNGSHERMHRTLRERAAIPPGRNRRDQQRKLDEFRNTYNNERPHEGLAMSRPGRLWRGGLRPYPNKIEHYVYPGWFDVRKVGYSGMLKWRSREIFISHALADEWIGLEAADYDRSNIYFGTFLIGQVDARLALLI